MIKNKRYYQVDVLYTIGVILVIIGHSHYSDWLLFDDTFFKTCLEFIYDFHMPLFFFLSGFLFANSDKLEKIGYSKWIGQKAIRFMTPYFVLSLIFVVPKYILENEYLDGLDGFVPYFFKCFLAPRNGVWGHFWFLPTLLIIYIIFGLWEKYIFKNENKIVYLISLILSLIIYFIPCETILFCFVDIKLYLVFFMFGITFYYVKNHISIKNNSTRILISLLLLISCILMYKYFILNSALKLIFANMMIFAMWNLACLAKNNRVVKWISQYCFTFYIYSWPFQYVVMQLCMIKDFDWYIATIIMFIVGFICPTFIVLIYNKLYKIHSKYMDLMLGIK